MVQSRNEASKNTAKIILKFLARPKGVAVATEYATVLETYLVVWTII